MSTTQFDILEADLEAALAEVPSAELDQRREFLEMRLGINECTDIRQIAQFNPANDVSGQFLDLPSYDIALLWLNLAELVTKQLKEENKKENLRLTNLAINAINQFRFYLAENKKDEVLTNKEIKSRESKASIERNKKKYEQLTLLVKEIVELYEPTIFSLRREHRIPTYRGVARRIEPRVRELNQQPDGSYLLGKSGDPVTAIKRRLERLANEGRIKSIREYKKD
jgi:hypothetical protein